MKKKKKEPSEYMKRYFEAWQKRKEKVKEDNKKRKWTPTRVY